MKSPITTPPRNPGMDLVRNAMTMLVKLHHSAIAYGGSGEYFQCKQSNASAPLPVMFNAINHSHSMHMLFLLAAYYTPRSFDREEPRRYSGDRLVRLAITLLAFFFVLYPLTVAMADTIDLRDVAEWWWHGILHGLPGPRPRYFAITLLIFAFPYTAWRAIEVPKFATATTPPPHRLIALAIILDGLAAFAVRLAMTVGRELLWLPLGYFPSYITLLGRTAC